MPNTLAHIAVNGIASRSLKHPLDLKWVYMGAILPDIPWIINRMVGGQALGLDPIEFRSYCIIQSSLLFCLVLSASGAAVSRRPRQTFLALSAGSFLHLLLDAAQTKWANGVSFFAPFDWQITNFGLFWPESPVTLLLSALGIGFFIAMAVAARKPAKVRMGHHPLRIIVLLSSSVLYLASPLLLIDGPIDSNAHFLNTMQENALRDGRYIELDRAQCRTDGESTTMRLLTGEVIRLQGLPRTCNTQISVKGEFVENDVIQIHEVHFHSGTFRDAASYLGLSLVLIWWLVEILRPMMTRGGRNQ